MFRQAVKKSLEEVDWISVIGDVSDGEELMEFLKTSHLNITLFIFTVNFLYRIFPVFFWHVQRLVF